jgi:hypothetical protein
LGAAGLLPTSIPPLGSVGVAALNVALSITKAPVVLAGLDFGYVDGRTHARNTPAHTWLMQKSGRIFPPEQGNLSMILKRPLMKGLTGDNKPILTDMVLRGYADLARQQIGSEDRVYTLGGQGIPNGAKVLKDAGDLKKILDTCMKPKAASFEARTFKNGDIRLFAENELKRLESVSRQLRTALSERRGRTECRLSDEQTHNLGEMDYLYFFFPDTVEWPGVNYGYLTRIYQSACDFQAQWRRTLSRLG